METLFTILLMIVVGWWTVSSIREDYHKIMDSRSDQNDDEIQ